MVGWLVGLFVVVCLLWLLCGRGSFHLDSFYLLLVFCLFVCLLVCLFFVVVVVVVFLLFLFFVLLVCFLMYRSDETLELKAR